MTVYRHIILDLPSIGLLEEGTEEEVGKKLQAAVVQRLLVMPIKEFLKYCHISIKRTMPETEVLIPITKPEGYQ